MFQHHLLGQTARLGFLLLKIETFFLSKTFHFLLSPCFMQLTINPLKETELILYGGEFYNGQKVSFQFFLVFVVLIPLVHKCLIQFKIVLWCECRRMCMVICTDMMLISRSGS